MEEIASFVIENIEKHRLVKDGNETEFYIKWEGYGPEENTWEVSFEEGERVLSFPLHLALR